MKRMIIAVAAIAALAGSAFAQADEPAFTAACSDYVAADADMQMQMAAAFNAALLESNSASEEIGETKGAKDDSQRMENIAFACEKNPNGSVFQAVKEVGSSN